MASSSSTTQVLHSSPALNALKRDQLLSLCRIHGVKGSGKNADIVRRLKHHARTSSIAFSQPGGESDTDESVGLAGSGMPRASEQWEVVMDTIDEADERSLKGTLTSLRTGPGEFGSGNSKGSGVGSSLKAFANSFGIRRTAAPADMNTGSSSQPSLAPDASLLAGTYTTRSTALTSPDTSAMQLDDSSPLPGTAARPGVPAPSGAARLSLGTGAGGAGPSTTMRLVGTGARPALASPPKLKPFATTLDLDMPSPARVPVWPKPAYPALPVDDEDSDMPGAFGSSGAALLSPPAPEEPFVFGSPAPRHSLSNAGFAAAADTMLAEMNRRLVAQGSAPVVVPLPDLLARGRAALANGNGGASEPGSPTAAPKDRFAGTHQAQFAKMESIADAVAKREAATAKTGAKRKSVARVVPGGFGDDDDEEDDEEPANRRLSKRPRVQPDAEDSDAEDPTAERERLAREQEVIQRKLAASRARRRSSRVSGVGARRVSIAKPPPKPRFGFFGAAKNIVKSVWGRAPAKPTPAPAKPAETKKLTKPAPAPALAPKAAVARPSVAGPSSIKPRASTAVGLAAVPRKSVVPRVPSNGTTASKATTASNGTAASRASTTNGTAASRATTATTTTPASSLGTRTSLAPRPSAAPHKRVSSVASSTAASTHKRTGSTDSVGAKRVSTLTAPTAASLARGRPLPTPPVPSASSKAGVIARNRSPAPAPAVLAPLNSPRPIIFGRPFAPLASPTKIPAPSPVRASASVENEPAAPAPGPSTLAPKAGGALRARPRISRSKVLAKVSAQRERAAGAGVGGSSALAPRPAGARKSTGAQRTAARRSLGAIKAPAAGDGAVAAAAKRRARQSEVARRRSGAAPRVSSAV